MALTLASNAITFTDNTALSSGIITSAQLSAGAVTTTAIASGAVTADKIAALPSNVVTTQTIANSAVTAEKMSGGQIGNAPVYGCRAWFAFDTTKNSSGGSDLNNTNRLILNSGNISYIQKVSSGSYRVVFLTPMPSVNYSVLVNANIGTNAVNDTFTEGTATNTLTSTQIGVSWNGSRYDGATYYTGCIFA